MVLSNIGTAWWILIAVLGIVGILALMRRRGEKVLGAKKNFLGTLFVLGAVFVFLWQGSYLAGIGLGPSLAVGTFPGAVQETTTTTQALPSGFCPGVEDTTVTLSSVDAYTTVATGGSHRYRVNGAPALTVSDAGTLTVSPGDKLEILWLNGSTTSAYYSLADTKEVLCVGTQTFSANLYNNGTLTIEVFNEEGNLIDTAGENETLASGDVVTLPFNLKGSYQNGFPYGVVVAVEYNTTEIDDIIVEIGGVKIDSPGFYTVNSTAHNVKFFTTSPILSSQILRGTLTIDVDDTVNPASDDDIDMRVYPINYFINEKNGGAYEGPAVEDEDDARTYTATFPFTLNID